jgi:hypothetical protein
MRCGIAPPVVPRPRAVGTRHHHVSLPTASHGASCCRLTFTVIVDVPPAPSRRINTLCDGAMKGRLWPSTSRLDKPTLHRIAAARNAISPIVGHGGMAIRYDAATLFSAADDGKVVQCQSALHPTRAQPRSASRHRARRSREKKPSRAIIHPCIETTCAVS